MTEQARRLKVRTVSYRQGFIEVLAGVHPSCVNLETFEIASEVDLAEAAWVDAGDLSDGDVVANTELELSPDEAERLAEMLRSAARDAREAGGGVGEHEFGEHE